MKLNQILHLFGNPEETRLRTLEEMEGTFEALLFTSEELISIQECLRDALLEREFLEETFGADEVWQKFSEWLEQRQ